MSTTGTPILNIITRRPLFNVNRIEAFTKAGLPTIATAYKEIEIVDGIAVHPTNPIDTPFTYWNAASLGYDTSYKEATVVAAGTKILNPRQAREHAEDKLATARTLHAVNIPTIPGTYATPGTPIPENHVAKPLTGRKGENILYWKTHTHIPYNLGEQHWLIQPYIPNSHQWLRILIIGNIPVTAYTRTPAAGSEIANVSQGATRTFIPLNQIREDTIETAIKASQRLGLTICGVDITNPEDEAAQIVELNSQPALPLVALPEIASALKATLIPHV